MWVNRRAAIGLLGAALVTGCSGVRPYKDSGTANLQVVLSAQESTFWTKRRVFVDVWTGPKGPSMEYLGTREISGSGSTLGLPVGRALHLAIAFEEKGGLGGYSSTSAVEIPVAPLSSRSRLRLDVAHTRLGFSHDLRRIS